MPLWVLGVLVIATGAAFYVIVLADKHDNPTIKNIGYLIGVTGIAAIVCSTLLKVYYLFDTLTKI